MPTQSGNTCLQSPKLQYQTRQSLQHTLRCQNGMHVKNSYTRSAFETALTKVTLRSTPDNAPADVQGASCNKTRRVIVCSITSDTNMVSLTVRAPAGCSREYPQEFLSIDAGSQWTSPLSWTGCLRCMCWCTSHSLHA